MGFTTEYLTERPVVSVSWVAVGRRATQSQSERSEARLGGGEKGRLHKDTPTVGPLGQTGAVREAPRVDPFVDGCLGIGDHCGVWTVDWCRWERSWPGCQCRLVVRMRTVTHSNQRFM